MATSSVTADVAPVYQCVFFLLLIVIWLLLYMYNEVWNFVFFLFLFKLIFNRDVTSIDIYLVSFRFVWNMFYYSFNKLFYLESSSCCSNGKMPPDRRGWETQHFKFGMAIIWICQLFYRLHWFLFFFLSFSRWYWFNQHLEIFIRAHFGYTYQSITGKVRACSILFSPLIIVISFNEVRCKRFDLIVRLTFEFTNLMKQISSIK